MGGKLPLVPLQRWQIAAGVIATNVNLGKDVTTDAISVVDSVMHL
jgi:hypothetical protein